MDWLDFITRPGLVYGLVAGVGIVAFALIVWAMCLAAGQADRMLQEGEDE